MAFVNEIEKQIAAKIVYFGPELTGKRSNLRFLHENYAESCGKVLRLERKGEGVLFMEYTPEDFDKIGPYTFRVHLYSPLEELKDKVTLQALFRGVDGLVFVADAQEERLDENHRFMKLMRGTLEALQQNLRELPSVLQFSKTDLPGSLAEEDMDEEINEINAPFYSANPVTGVRVEETFTSVARLAYRKIRDELKVKKFGGWYKYTALEALLKKNFDNISDFAKELASPSFEAEDYAAVAAAEKKGVPEFAGIEQSGELDELDALLEPSPAAAAAPVVEEADSNLDSLFGAEEEPDAKREDPLARTILAGQGKAIRDLVEDISPSQIIEKPAEGIKTVVSKAAPRAAKPGGDGRGAAPAAVPTAGGELGRTVRVDRSQLTVGAPMEAAAEVEEAAAGEAHEITAEIRSEGADSQILSIPLDIPATAAKRGITLTLELRIRFR